MVNIYALSVAIFFLILAILIYKDRKNIEFKYILIIKRTKKGKKLLDRIAGISPNFWKVVSTLAIFFCIYIMFSSLLNLVISLKFVIEEKIPIVQFVVPLPKPQPIAGRGFIGIPFWFWIVLIPFVLIPHEISHGIVARAEKIRIKSVGLLLLAILPGAFVEPDEKQVEKSKLVKKLRIFCAGSASNFFFVFVLLILTRHLIWPFFVSPGLVLNEVNETSPAEQIGLKQGMVIQAIDGKKAEISFDHFGLSYGFLLFARGNMTEENVQAITAGLFLREILKSYKPNDTITLKVDSKFYELKLGSHPQNPSWPYIGILSAPNFKTNGKIAFSIIFPLIWLCIVLGWAVASFNLLPIYPLDGGLIIDGIAKIVSEKYRKKIVFLFTGFTLSLLILGFTLPFLK